MTQDADNIVELLRRARDLARDGRRAFLLYLIEMALMEALDTRLPKADRRGVRRRGSSAGGV